MSQPHHVAFQPIDRRSLSNMAPEIRVLHQRLEAWAKWSRERISTGWPERTILGRLIEEGPGASHSSGAPTAIPDAIAEMDRAVGHLTGDDRRVIREYYLRWEPREVLARRLRLTPKRMDGILNRARWRLVGFLSASLIPE